MEYLAGRSATTLLWGVPAATTTTLTLTSGGTPVTTAVPGTVITLAATVAAGGAPLTAGQVNFCDASAPACTDIHLLGSVALSPAGVASFKFVPGPGAHTYRAVFVRTNLGLTSSSDPVALNVGPTPAPVYSDNAAISYFGGAGAYSLTATIEGFGGPAPLTGNVSFLDTSFSNTSLAAAPLGPSKAGLGWLISQIATPSNNPLAEATGDFNGDGIVDLAVLFSDSYGESCSYAIYLGKGDGTFLPNSALVSLPGQNYTNMISGDFNGDGKVDLALLNYGIAATNNVVTLLGSGDGTFTQSAASVVFVQPLQGGDLTPGSMVTADFNGDGKLDLAVVGDAVTGGISIALGNGDGTFSRTPSNVAPTAAFGYLATGDFNGDGVPDLVASLFFQPGTTTVFLGNGDGTFTAVPQILPTELFGPSIVVGDFNADGKLDMALGYSADVAVFTGNGDGTFNQVNGSPFTSAGLGLVQGDFNHDGKLDLAGIDQYGSTIDLLLGGGDGTFTSTATTPFGQSYNRPFLIAAADFNQDGVPDLAMLTEGQPSVPILLTTPTQTATATVNGIAPVGAGTHNVLASYAGDSNYPPVQSPTVALSAGLVPVLISPAAGTYTSALTVTLTEPIPGATIYYQVFGPLTTTGYVPYTGPLTLNLGGTYSLYFYATEAGYQNSSYGQAIFTLNLPQAPAPVFSLAAGSYANSQTVTLSDTATKATIYYTTDGTVPTAKSPVYSGPITISTSEVIAAVVTAAGYDPSQVVSAQYLIDSSQSSFIYTVAGNESIGYAGDGGPATFASLNFPSASAVDAAGNLYIADSGNNVVRKIAASTGLMTTVAGTGIAGSSGDNGPGTSAQLNDPAGLAFDTAGNLYVADAGNQLIRKIAAGTGVISTIAGSLTATSLGDNGPATGAQLFYPRGVAVDNAGNLYIADTARVRKVNSAGIITTFAGTGSYGYSGDGGAASNAMLGYVAALAIDSGSNLYASDSSNGVVRKITATTGVITTVAGIGPAPFGGIVFSGDGGPATSAQLNQPYGIALDVVGNLYIADSYNGVIREVTASNGIINTIVSHAPQTCSGLGGDGGLASNASLCYPYGVSTDAAGNLYVADTFESRIRKVTTPMQPPAAVTAAPIFSVAAGTYINPQTVIVSDATPGAEVYITVNGGPASTSGAGYYQPIDVTGSGTLQAVAVAPGYLPSAPVTAAYIITTPPASIVTTVAGSGLYGGSGSGGPATSANLGGIGGAAFDKAGNLYLADTTNDVVWKVSAGTITVVAGTLGYGSYQGDGGLATSAYLQAPSHVAVDAEGNLYIADSSNNRVRVVAASTGIISNFAGGGTTYSPTLGDGQLATSALLSSPQGLAFDSSGNLYLADNGDNRIRMVAAGTGIITTVAGGSTTGLLGDGGLAVAATVRNPSDIAIDAQGNLYIAESGGARVRLVEAKTGIISTLAGNGDSGSSGDGDLATSAEVSPGGIALDQAGNVYIASYQNSVRKIPAGGGVITTVVGTGLTGSSADGYTAKMTSLCGPYGILFDQAGSLYVTEYCNSRVRKVTYPAPASAPVFSLAAGTYTGPQTLTITDATPAAAIYYTTDASLPTPGSTLYNGPINIASGETVQAIAVAAGYTESAVTSAAYVINQPIAASVALASSENPVLIANPVTLTVTVTGSPGNPSGSVKFLDGGAVLGSATLNSGTAAFTTASLAAGSHSITAAYSGDQVFSPATSSALTLIVQTAALSVAPGGSSTASIAAGGQATYALLALPPVTGAPLTFTVTGLPAGASAGFSPGSIPAGSTATNVLLSVSVPAAHAVQRAEYPYQQRGPFVLLGLLLIPFVRRLRRTSKRYWLGLVACAGLGLSLGLTGCGSSGSAHSTPSTYTLTVTAAAGSFSQSINLTLNVD